DDGRPAALELLALRVENPLQVGEIFTGHARGRDAGHGGLEHAAHVQQLVLGIVAVAQDRDQRRHQPVDVQLLRKRALAGTRGGQTDGSQRAERVADRPAADAEPSGELALGGQRQACGEGAVENQHSDAVGDLLGDTRLSGGLDHERLSLRGPLPGTARPPDAPQNGCQTHPPDWFDHRATLTHCGSRTADCGLRIKLRIGIAGRDLKQPIFNSIRNPQSAVRDPQYQGGVWSSSQTDRPSSCHARSRNTPAARAMSPPSSYRGRATPRRCPWRSPRSRATGGPSSTPTSARFTSSPEARSGPPCKSPPNRRTIPS